MGELFASIYMMLIVVKAKAKTQGSQSRHLRRVDNQNLEEDNTYMVMRA